MKKVLLITTEEVHQFLYGGGLREYFSVEVVNSTRGVSGKFDAVVYDLPKYRLSIDFNWLKSLDVPLVVLTPDRRLRIPEAPRRVVLEYPVSLEQIIKTLAGLGVVSERKR